MIQHKYILNKFSFSQYENETFKNMFYKIYIFVVALFAHNFSDIKRSKFTYLKKLHKSLKEHSPKIYIC